MQKPNVIYIIADQWRAHATGYAGDPDVLTPNIDRLAGKSINLHNAVSSTPLCTAYRASFLTGQFPLTHYDCLSAFGNERINTPNMDSLVENGISL